MSNMWLNGLFTGMLTILTIVHFTMGNRAVGWICLAGLISAIISGIINGVVVFYD